MGKLLDLESARQSNEHKRKDAKVQKLQASFRNSRKKAVSKSEAAEKLKRLFKAAPKPKK